MCRRALATLVALTVMAPLQSRAQVLQSFEDLALRVNLEDRLQVEDQAGAIVAGRLTVLTRDAMAIQTDAGEKRFTSETVRQVAVRGHAFRRGVIIGAAVFAVLGAVAVCENEGGRDCALVGSLGAAPIGAGLGLAIGALVPQKKPVYRAPESRLPVPRHGAESVVQFGVFDRLALRVNLNDRLLIESRSGDRTTGRMTHLTADELTIETSGGGTRFAPDAVREISVRRQPIRTATLVGAGAGAAIGAVAGCTGPEREECADAAVISGALGAGVGVVVGALLRSTTVVYPEPERRTFLAPAFSRGAISVWVSRRW